MGLWWLSVATGQGVAGFVIAQTEDASDATYYYGLGVATLLMALVLFAVAPVDPTADGRRRGHRAGLGAAGPGTAGPPRVRRLSLGFVG